MPQQYCLRWKHHHTNVQSMFSMLLEKERFCDVTLYCSPSFTAQLPENGTVDSEHIKGESLRAHRVVLAACSDLLAALLSTHESQGEPVLVIDGAEPKHIRQLLDYMYTGEMNVHHSQLASLLKTAEDLRIKGLTDIRWNNKDEPPDCKTGSITATSTENENKRPEKEVVDDMRIAEKVALNGGPPPLIKISKKDKKSPSRKRESDTDTQSPKRQRVTSRTEVTDDEEKEWQHGNMDISAERVVNWGEPEMSVSSWTKEEMDEEWPDATDIGSFLHTNLRVDGDNSGDEGSGDCATSSASARSGSHLDSKMDCGQKGMTPPTLNKSLSPIISLCKSGIVDPRFNDVIKLNEYLLHGRRPQFWEEEYVKRVMEMVRLKELEMKQAAEVLGVSYGTLYGRYRDVYGCINRPYRQIEVSCPDHEEKKKRLLYRTTREYWKAKRPSEIVSRLQRQEISLEAAAASLGVTVSQLSGYCSGVTMPSSTNEELLNQGLFPDEGESPFPTHSQFGKLSELDLELVPIRADSERKVPTKSKKTYQSERMRKLFIDTIDDQDDVPATTISIDDTTNTAPKVPCVRLTPLEHLRSGSSSSSACESASTSPTIIMKSRPDLTIVAAKKESEET